MAANQYKALEVRTEFATENGTITITVCSHNTHKKSFCNVMIVRYCRNRFYTQPIFCTFATYSTSWPLIFLLALSFLVGPPPDDVNNMFVTQFRVNVEVHSE